MFTPTLVSRIAELESIVALSVENHRAHVDETYKKTEGFISWSYTVELLQQMHALHPSVIIKDGEAVVAYALVALKAAATFHPDLEAMIAQLDKINHKGRPLSAYRYYVMGQVCIAAGYRGKGLFNLLYQEHKRLFHKAYDFVVTEISVSNTRSLNAHKKIGFETIHIHRDAQDEWHVVMWDWK